MRSRAAWFSWLVVLAASCLAPSGAAATGASSCTVPRLTGLTLEVARRRLARAGCALEARHVAPQFAGMQTVAAQLPSPGRRSSRVTVWLNPLCHGGAAYAPQFEEPAYADGPSELLSGFYLDGGPLVIFSDPRCRRPEPSPEAGSVEVLDAAGSVVATASSSAGQLVAIPLAPGAYTLRGTPARGGGIGLAQPLTKSVVVKAGETVREDFVVPIS
jgi:hypothetical protein